MVPLFTRRPVLVSCDIDKLQRHKQDIKESVETEVCREPVDVAWSVGRLEDLDPIGTLSAWSFDGNWQHKLIIVDCRRIESRTYLRRCCIACGPRDECYC